MQIAAVGDRHRKVPSWLVQRVEDRHVPIIAHRVGRRFRAARQTRYNSSAMLRPFRGHVPVVDPATYIDISAQVIGQVEIGAESSVWMNVVIRGDVNHITIGRRTNVQDGTVVHAMTGTDPTRVGDDVTIGTAPSSTAARLATASLWAWAPSSSTAR